MPNQCGIGEIILMFALGALVSNTLLTGTTSLALPKGSIANTEDLYSKAGLTSDNNPKILQSDQNKTLSFEESPSSPFTDTKEITLIAQDTQLSIAKIRTNETRITAWTFNNTVPAPPLRFTEGDNITIHFINNGSTNHTIHFHGNHDDKNDGYIPQVEPKGNYTYRITAAPAGALMYHCHAYPTSEHIRMGMYGALIIDPKNKTLLQPAKEFVMVMSEFNPENPMAFEADYYLINGYYDQYMHTNALRINHGDLIRLYVINMGTTIVYPFHLHSTTFKVYPSGLLDNKPVHMQTVPIAPGDATIVEAKWNYPGTYLFHSHGFQEERGNMGEVNVMKENDNSNSSIVVNSTAGGNSPSISQSVSMFDWQYELQKRLQKPVSISMTEQEDKTPTSSNEVGMGQITFVPSSIKSSGRDYRHLG